MFLSRGNQSSESRLPAAKELDPLPAPSEHELICLTAQTLSKRSINTSTKPQQQRQPCRSAIRAPKEGHQCWERDASSTDKRPYLITASESHKNSDTRGAHSQQSTHHSLYTVRIAVITLVGRNLAGISHWFTWALKKWVIIQEWSLFCSLKLHLVDQKYK